MSESSASAVVVNILAPHLQRSDAKRCSIVIMTCGIAGSGKTTLAKVIQAQYPSMHRLSIDEIIYSNHGIYGIDYPASFSLYEVYSSEADLIYLDTFRNLLAQSKDVILERSFYALQDRQIYRELAEASGAKVVLVFLRAEKKEVLWERIQKRSNGVKTANSALDIDRQTFERYWNGFESPNGEEEIVVEVN